MTRTAMVPVFAKGEHVYLLSLWSNENQWTWSIRAAVVESCGKKIMTLRDRDTGTMIGERFAPTELQRGAGLVVRGNLREVINFALVHAEDVRQRELAAARRVLNRHQDNYALSRVMRDSVTALERAVPRVALYGVLCAEHAADFAARHGK